MKILKYGKVKPIQMTCEHCEGEFEYLRKEACWDSGKLTLSCPICGHKLVVEPETEDCV